MVYWLLAVKLSLLVIIAGIVGLVLPQAPWPAILSYTLLGVGVVVFTVSVIAVGRRFLGGASPR